MRTDLSRGRPRFLTLRGLALGGALLCGPELVEAANYAISPTGPQDAYVAPGIGHIDRASHYNMWGQWNGSVTPVSMHTLPSVPAGDVLSATLRVPQPDIDFTGGPPLQYDLTILAKHIDALDDTQASLGDGTSAALAAIGTYRLPGPYVADNSRTVSFDVTALVITDLLAGRATFAWRLETLATNGPGPNLSYFPSADNTDTAFPLRGGLLSIETIPEPGTLSLLVVGVGLLLKTRKRQ